MPSLGGHIWGLTYNAPPPERGDCSGQLAWSHVQKKYLIAQRHTWSKSRSIESYRALHKDLPELFLKSLETIVYLNFKMLGVIVSCSDTQCVKNCHVIFIYSIHVYDPSSQQMQVFQTLKPGSCRTVGGLPRGLLEAHRHYFLNTRLIDMIMDSESSVADLEIRSFEGMPQEDTEFSSEECRQFKNAPEYDLSSHAWVFIYLPTPYPKRGIILECCQGLF